MLADLILRIAFAAAILVIVVALLVYVVAKQRVAKPKRSIAALESPGKHRTLPPGETVLAGVWHAETEQFRSGEHPIIDPIVIGETQRSDFARKQFEADPLGAPLLPDLCDESPIFFSTITTQTVRGVLGIDAAGDLDTTGAFAAADVRRLLAEQVGVR
jgi:hypothetical protein